MKRRHLFEFEDQRWFPDILRVCITRYIMFIHRLFGTSEKIETHLCKLMSETGQKKIVDLCSGAGGPMIEVYKNLKKRKEFGDLELMMSDLYPNKAQAHKVNGLGDKRLTYSLESVDATSPNAQYDGIRTMVASFHHMPVAAAKKIL